MDISQVKIRIKNSDAFYDIRSAAMNTIGREAARERGMSSDVFYKYIISEHSPIRAMDIRIELSDIPSPVSIHLVRHVHTIPFVRTGRPDRTGEARDPNKTVVHFFECNPQSLIDMMRKRLCVGKVEKATFETCLAIKMKMYEVKELRPLAKALVPNCVYRCGCPEFDSCGAYGYESEWIQDRYNRYEKVIFHKQLLKNAETVSKVREAREKINDLINESIETINDGQS